MVVERWAGALGLAMVPVAAVVAVDPAGASPFGPARAVAVPALVLGGAAAACWGAPIRLVRRTALAWVLVLVVVAASAAGGLDGRAAWLGTAERRLGALAWVLFAVAFAGGQVLGADRARRVVAAGAVVALGLLGAWSTAEALGWRPIPLVGAGPRLGGPFGSSAFLGAAAALLLPVGAGVALDRSWSRWWRRLAAAATAVGAVGLIGSGARAAWLGVAGAGALAAWRGRPALTAWWSGQRRAGRSRQAGARMAGAMIAGLLVVALIGAATGVGGRVPGALTDDRGGLQGRFDEWRVATRTVARHPLLGVGPEGGRIAFGAAVDDAYERAHGRSHLPDRAHSGPLDVAVTSGLLGLVLVAWLWLAVGRHLRRASGGGEAWLAGVTLGVTAYAVQQLALFPLSELDPVAWLLAGLVVGATARPGEELALPQTPVVAVAAAAAAAAVLVAGVPTVVADRRARQAQVGTSDGTSASGTVFVSRDGISLERWSLADLVGTTARGVTSVIVGEEQVQVGVLLGKADDRGPLPQAVLVGSTKG